MVCGKEISFYNFLWHGIWHQLCDEMPEMLSAIDWSVFGFQGRDGKDTTLWVGSEGACTPCHTGEIIASSANQILLLNVVLYSPDPPFLLEC